MNASGAPVVITLPLSTLNAGMIACIYCINSSYACAVITTTPDTIFSNSISGSSIALSTGDSYILQATPDNNGWIVISSGLSNISSVAQGLSPSYVIYEVNFGAVPVYDATFVVPDTNCTNNSIVAAYPCGVASSQLSGDELTFDSLCIGCSAGPGYFTMFITAIPGPITATRNVVYSISNYH